MIAVFYHIPGRILPGDIGNRAIIDFADSAMESILFGLNREDFSVLKLQELEIPGGRATGAVWLSLARNIVECKRINTSEETLLVSEYYAGGPYFPEFYKEAIPENYGKRMWPHLRV